MCFSRMASITRRPFNENPAPCSLPRRSLSGGGGQAVPAGGGAQGEVGEQMGEIHQPLGDDMGNIAFEFPGR